ncbi:MAG: hypothetical protein WCG20_00960 [bacterium]
MKHNPFDTIAYWLGNQKMSPTEKRDMRHVLLEYATTHPVKSGLLSPYSFKYMTVALASLVLVLGTSVGITSASTTALPNQSLYGVKLWIEEFQANNQKTAEAKIAFETRRITTRFDEAATLAVRRELNDTTSQMIQSGLEHSRESVRTVADSIQETNPELALQAINNLETTFSSNGRVLATIEQNTNQNIGTIVLAAEHTVERLALEKVKFEQVIALKPNSNTKTTTEEKFTAITEKLKTVPEITTVAAVAPVEPVPVATMALMKTMDVSTLSSTDSTTTPAVIEPVEDKKPTLNELVAGAKEKINQGSYSEALVSLQKAEQVIDEANLTKSLEKTYNVKTAPKQ